MRRLAVAVLLFVLPTSAPAQDSSVSIQERTGSNNAWPHAELEAPGSVGLLHYERNPCYPNSMAARASAGRLWTIAGAWLCNSVGNSTETMAGVTYRDVVFHGTGSGTASVALRYDTWGSITPNQRLVRHTIEVRMGLPGTDPTGWASWSTFVDNPPLGSAPITLVSGAFTVPLNVPVGVSLRSRTFVVADEYADVSVSLPVNGPVFQVPSGVTVSSHDANVTGNTWGGARVPGTAALTPSPLAGSAGATTALTLHGGQPNDAAVFLVAPGFRRYPLCLSPTLCVGLDAVILVLGQGQADASGLATLGVPLPSSVPPMRIYMQGAWLVGGDPRGWRTSDVLVYDIL